MHAEIRARYYDGKTAAAHDVVLTYADGVLRLSASDLVADWPRDKIIRLDDRRDAEILRLGVSTSPDERLLLDGVDVVRLNALAPELFDHRPARRAEYKLVAALVAGAALVGGGIFFGVPMAAKPLASVTPLAMERNIGDAVYAQAQLTFGQCTGSQAARADMLLNRIADRLERHATSEFDVDVQLVDSFMPNAFALPGGRVLITDELVAMAQDPDEIAGVIAHEIGHVEQRHVMQLIWRDMGFGILLDIMLGGSGVVQQIYLTSGQVFQLRYSREAEEEADRRAIAMMSAAGWDPGAMGMLFERLAEEMGEKEIAEADRERWEFLSSHPDTLARAAKARAGANPNAPDSLTQEEWAAVKHFGCMNDLTEEPGPFDRIGDAKPDPSIESDTPARRQPSNP